MGLEVKEGDYLWISNNIEMYIYKCES